MARMQPNNRYRYGIGEWYGRLFNRLTPEERRQFANIQKTNNKIGRPNCPYMPSEKAKPCPKGNGICSVRRYIEYVNTKEVAVVQDDTGGLRIVCPLRFQENGFIYHQVGKVVLETEEILTISEVGFLTSIVGEDEEGDDVGRIDQIILVPDSKPLDWCALEVQAVYLSGKTMNIDFANISDYQGDGLPFPAGMHRPDYRSSGPKRLMPQLQIKVPTLRRWGKKMVVVVDKYFFDALAPMEMVNDISNCDIVWFVVAIEEPGSETIAHLVPYAIRYTTLERAVEGLTAGIPVSKKVFEERILEKYRQQEQKRGRNFR